MVQQDVKFNHETELLIQSLIGKKIVSIEHDAFTFTNTSSQVVKINTEIGSMFIYNFAEPKDYYGTEEDVAVMTFEQDAYPMIAEKNFIVTPIDQIIKNVTIVNENQKLFESGKQTYDVWLTRGIIFDFGDLQLSFEKAVWFSEDIEIRKGYDLIEKFSSTNDFTKQDKWATGISSECERVSLIIG